ncbi:MAG: helix-turn-helix domain-containing protein [Legionellales bacterium]|nr:helix-turn-helix domain-containing protein [Legionellales bacterium]
MKHREFPVQIIENNGTPEWAVLPYEDYLRLQEVYEIAHDLDHFKSLLTKGQEEFIPEEYAERLVQGENAIKVWREYRQIKQVDLAKRIGVSTPYLSQLENNSRSPSIEVLKKISIALNVSTDDLIQSDKY